jgi:RNA polymerase sigma factor (sigma-70 family)
MAVTSRPSHVAAARLVRQALKQQGRPSPDWINALAAKQIAKQPALASTDDAERKPRHQAESALDPPRDLEFETTVENAPASQTPADQPVVDREQLGYLHDAIAELPVQLRYVIQAFFFDEREVADIAAGLGVTPSRTAQLRAEALRLLRDALTVSRDSRPPPEAIQFDDSAVISYAAAVAARHNLRTRLGGDALSSELVDPGDQHAAGLLSILRQSATG